MQIWPDEAAPSTPTPYEEVSAEWFRRVVDLPDTVQIGEVHFVYDEGSGCDTCGHPSSVEAWAQTTDGRRIWIDMLDDTFGDLIRSLVKVATGEETRKVRQHSQGPWVTYDPEEHGSFEEWPRENRRRA